MAALIGVLAFLTISDLGARTKPSSPASTPDATEEVQAPRKPTTSGDLPTRVSMQLRIAFPLAVKRLRKVPSCQALFEELGANGVEAGEDGLVRAFWSLS